MPTRPLFIEVALPVSIALDETFDYILPPELREDVRPGLRVRVPFRKKTLTGFCLNVKKTSPYRSRCRPVLSLVDTEPLLDEGLWRLAREMRDTYACGLADILNTFLPQGVKSATTRRSNAAPGPEFTVVLPIPLTQDEQEAHDRVASHAGTSVIRDPSGTGRWALYRALIKTALNEKKSVILTVAQHDEIPAVLERLRDIATPLILSSYRSRKEARQAWYAARRAPSCLVLGTRSAVFAPVKNLGTIIIDRDDHFAYHQDQAPCYKTSDIARKRARDAGAHCILGSVLPSLTNAYLCEKGEASLVTLPLQEPTPQITLLDLTRAPDNQDRRTGLSRPITHRLSLALQEQERILIVTHQKCFVSALYCRRCSRAVTCPRCSVPMKEYQKEKTLRCHVCGHKDPIPDLCPNCHRSYMRHIGFGSEKTLKELQKLFSAARIRAADTGTCDIRKYDIILATPAQLTHPGLLEHRFDRVFVLDADQPLVIADYRAAEQTFGELWKLRLFAKRELCLQTRWPEHYVFDLFKKGDIDGFAQRELGERGELGWPPLRNMAILTVRSALQHSALTEAVNCTKALKKSAAAGQGTEIMEPVEARPFKVRGNFRYQVFIRSEDTHTVRQTVRRLIKKRRGRVYLIFDPAGR